MKTIEKDTETFDRPPTVKQRAVLNAARETFLRDGFGGTSMDDIALSAEVARRTVYNQFGSKENLFRAVIVDIWGQINPGQLIADACKDKEPEEGLLAIGMTIAHHWASPLVVAFLRLSILEGDHFPELPKSFYKYGKEPIVLAVQTHLTRMAGEGFLHIDDPVIATQQFIGMINEPLLWMKLINAESDNTLTHRENIVKKAVSLFIRGYRIQP